MAFYILLAFTVISGSLCLPDGEEYLAETGDKFEGDIILETGGDFRNIIPSDSKRWPNGIVPYNLGGEYSSSEKSLIRSSLAEMSSLTCLKFVQRTSQRAYIQVNKLGGCFSAVGFGNRKQQLSLAQGCLRKGIIIHEFLHALGLWHEQSRPDRDQYVDVFWQNMSPSMKHNFNKQTNARTLGFKYDYDSLMHYGKYGFSINGKPTLLPKDRSKNIGQRKGMSTTDIGKINKLYNCNGVVGPTVKPTTGKPVTQKPTGDKCLSPNSCFSSSNCWTGWEPVPNKFCSSGRTCCRKTTTTTVTNGPCLSPNSCHSSGRCMFGYDPVPNKKCSKSGYVCCKKSTTSSKACLSPNACWTQRCGSGWTPTSSDLKCSKSGQVCCRRSGSG